MNCPARCFDCGCPAGTCQTPHYAALEPAIHASTARILIHSAIIGVFLMGVGLAVMSRIGPVSPW